MRPSQPVHYSAYKDGIIYIEDVVRGQWSAHKREVVIKQTAETDAMRSERFPVKTYVEREPGSGGKESAESPL
jgi:hypothetical protein